MKLDIGLSIMMPVPAPREGSSMVGRAAQEADGVAAMPSWASTAAIRADVGAVVRTSVR